MVVVVDEVDVEAVERRVLVVVVLGDFLLIRQRRYKAVCLAWFSVCFRLEEWSWGVGRLFLLSLLIPLGIRCY